ncbi:hypothetical protein ACJJI3_11140 [Microbulbifer sp. ZKSA004]|uniref:hypothetical protein n=1 Tax=Microbulbifer sp. ZKSA004 TaxID=3243389 RepID=UPI004039ECF2
MENIEIPKDIVQFVDNLIDSGKEEFEVIKIQVLQDETKQHDDDLIKSIVHEFTQILQRLASVLENKYGPAKIVLNADFDEEEEDEFEEGDEEFYIPCSFSSAVWTTDDFTLYLGVCQEDREFPIVLAVGVEY